MAPAIKSLVLAITAVTIASSDPAVHQRGDIPQTPPLVYSPRADDPWNRIFALLFTRTVRTRMSDDFAESGPFTDLRPETVASPLRVSTRLFDRYEDGDRAIDAFYPSFFVSTGLRLALTPDAEKRLSRALLGALDDRSPRSPVARALMQADLWSAFDELAQLQLRRDPYQFEMRQAAARILPLVVRLMRKVALARDEIAGLPNNYARARRDPDLPDVFSPDSPWIEVVYAPLRMHDNDVSFRRASRVFVKPAATPADPQRFLDALPDTDSRLLAGAVLMMQVLLVDQGGEIRPSPLVSDVQTRLFTHRPDGGTTTGLHEFELSRRLMLNAPATGGFIAFDDRSPAYLPAAGNDYRFASPLFDRSGATAPLLTTLRRRCASCHGRDNDGLMGFSLVHGPDTPLPPVVRLPQPNETHARDIAARKTQANDFKLLMEMWNGR